MRCENCGASGYDTLCQVCKGHDAALRKASGRGLARESHELRGRCQACGTTCFRDLCSHCESNDMRMRSACGRGIERKFKYGR